MPEAYLDDDLIGQLVDHDLLRLQSQILLQLRLQLGRVPFNLSDQCLSEIATPFCKKIDR